MDKRYFEDEIKYDAIESDDFQYSDTRYGIEEDAVYVKALNGCDYGNPFVEALVPPRTRTEVMNEDFEPIKNFDKAYLLNLPYEERILRLGALESIRFPLPYEPLLESLFYDIIVDSYRERRPVTYRESDGNETTAIIANKATGTNAGIFVCGPSGNGKTTSIGHIIYHQKQIILHHFKSADIHQIVYVFVNCNTLRDFKDIFIAIGEEIDKLLHINICAERVRKCKHNDERVMLVEKFIEAYAIGMIILDEIQHISFSNESIGTFNSFLTISNDTKCSLWICGTTESFYKYCTSQRIVRRVGNVIMSNEYTKDRKFFTAVFQHLWEYNYFDIDIPLTQDIINEAFLYTGGSMQETISLFSFINRRYLEKNGKVIIDKNFIDEVAKKYKIGLKDELCPEPDFEKSLTALKRKKILESNTVISAEDYIEPTIDFINSKTPRDEIVERHLIENIVANVKKISDDYNDDSIRTAFAVVRKMKKYCDCLDESILTGAVMNRLCNNLSDKKKKLQNGFTKLFPDK
jgi:hypothetical protein